MLNKISRNVGDMLQKLERRELKAPSLHNVLHEFYFHLESSTRLYDCTILSRRNLLEYLTLFLCCVWLFCKKPLTSLQNASPMFQILYSNVLLYVTDITGGTVFYYQILKLSKDKTTG